MRPALKSIGSLMAGLVVAGAVMMLIEFLNGRVLYPELAKAAEGVTDQEAVRRIFATAPLGALLGVVAACALGGLAGGWLTARLTRPLQGPALALAALLTLAGVGNNLMLPPPLWFWTATLIALPAGTLLGARLARAR